MKILSPATRLICKRELFSYFSTPMAYIFLVLFLLLSNALTFFMGGFFAAEQADLRSFFLFHPWLYLIFIPALTMRLWSEERKNGSIELLMTLPITALEAALGKFFAAWIFTGIALLLTVPLWLTVNYLGQPDNGIIALNYLASWLLAGALVSVGCFCSALCKNQMVAFILSSSLTFMFILSGTPVILSFFKGWLPSVLLEGIASMSVLTHYAAIGKGLVGVHDMVFFGVMIAHFIAATTLIIQTKKAD
jgi:ABC-2 type transport system permease protein